MMLNRNNQKYWGLSHMDNSLRAYFTSGLISSYFTIVQVLYRASVI